MDLFKQFATDGKAEIEGTWFPFGDVEFLIARSGNKNYSRRLSKLYEQNRVVLNQEGDEAEAKSDEVMADVMANTILLGWKGSVVFQGQPLTYSVEAAKKVLMLKDFRVQVSRWSDDVTAFKVKEEVAAGNA